MGPRERWAGRWQGRQRDGLVISSKSPYLDESGALLTAEAFRENLETSLRELGLETIDIYFIHGLRPAYYYAARERFLPVLEAGAAGGEGALCRADRGV